MLSNRITSDNVILVKTLLNNYTLYNILLHFIQNLRTIWVIRIIVTRGASEIKELIILPKWYIDIFKIREFISYFVVYPEHSGYHQKLTSCYDVFVSKKRNCFPWELCAKTNSSPMQTQGRPWNRRSTSCQSEVNH